MRKILYLVTQSELGGAQRYILDLAKNLKNDFEISVAFGEQSDEDELASKLRQNNIKFYTIPHLKRAISPLNDILAIFQIAKLIIKIKPNIIHLNSSKISILGSIATLISKLLIVNCKLSIVYTVHGWVFNEPMPKWKKIFYTCAEKWTARFKDKIICINELDYNIAKNKFKIPEKKLTLIHHGIKPINFLSRENAREKLISIINNSTFDIQYSTILLGSIGNLYKTKGYEYLIKAFKILISNFQFPISLVIIGEGRERENLEKLIKKYNLEKNIILTGKIKNASELLNAFNIYVCSSVKEGFPYSILEAMGAGLPIISSNVGGIPEMIEDKESGLLIEPADPEKLANKIKYLMKNKETEKTMGENAKLKIEEEFKLSKMIEETKEIYK